MLFNRLYKACKVELWLVVLFTGVLVNFYDVPEQTIAADGVGYYEYLPATFHHKDINRHEQNYISGHVLYKRIDSIGKEIYVEHDVYLVNKYPIGTAICLAPFFTFTYLYYAVTHQELTCYEYPFQLTVWIGALVFVFLALIYLRKLLLTYQISYAIIRWMQLLLLLATPLTRYAHIEASMSHVYSLAVVTATAYYVRQFFQSPQSRFFILSCAGLAMIVLLRQVNGLVILFLPFLAGSTQTFSAGLRWLFKHIGVLLLGSCIALSLLTIQCFFWWLQTGKLIIYSYTNERFYFNDPHFFSILFGFKKGLFIYTPVLFLVFTGLYYFVKQKQWYLLLTWLVPFLMINYVLSSWWSWFYGCSFGLRAYIDYFPFFFILVALALTHLTYKFWLILFGIITIPLNLIQTYQYQYYILHWINMDWERYKTVFLHTGKQYGGLIWRQEFDASEYDTLSTLNLGTISVDTEHHFLSKIPTDSLLQLSNADMFQLSFMHRFNEGNPGELVFVVADSSESKIDFYANRKLLHFSVGEFDSLQRGWYNFSIAHKPERGSLFIINYEQSSIPEQFNDVQLILFKRKKTPRIGSFLE